MAWERKIMRTIRVRNEHKLGTLARLMTAISNLGASVGTMELVNETAQSVVRDITEAGGTANGTPGVNPGGYVVTSGSDVDCGVLAVASVRTGATEGADRTSAVGGERVGQGVDLGGRRISKKRNTVDNANAAVRVALELVGAARP